jgi:large subunit ribosomal protein L15
MGMKVKKAKKAKKLRGSNSHGHGSRKKWKGSGHHGGCGMSGTGKRADHKKTLVTKLYGNKYFGKKGITSMHARKKEYKSINLRDIQKNLASLQKKYGKKDGLVLKGYRVLGEGELKGKLVIAAEGFSNSAKEKIEKAGGSAILLNAPKEGNKGKQDSQQVENGKNSEKREEKKE